MVGIYNIGVNVIDGSMLFNSSFVNSISNSVLNNSKEKIQLKLKPEIYGEHIAYIVIPKGTKIFYIEGITDAPFDLEILFGKGKNLKFIKQESKFISHWSLM